MFYSWFGVDPFQKMEGKKAGGIHVSLTIVKFVGHLEEDHI